MDNSFPLDCWERFEMYVFHSGSYKRGKLFRPIGSDEAASFFFDCLFLLFDPSVRTFQERFRLFSGTVYQPHHDGCLYFIVR